MIYGIYAIRDAAANTYIGLTLDANDATAMRNFRHALLREDTLFASHPSDYNLYCFGRFDSDSGVFDLDPSAALVAEGYALKFASALEGVDR